MEISRETNIKDIAERAKVSVGTVDRVLHNRIGVSKKTKEKILQIISELNYKPNVIASNLAKQKVFNVEIIFINESENSYYKKQFLKGIERAKNEIEQFSIKIEVKIIHLKIGIQMNDFMLNSDIQLLNGCIFVNRTNKKIKHLLKQCEQNQLPFVLIGEDLEEDEVHCTIQLSSYESGKLVGQLFNTLFNEGSVLILTQQGEICKKTKGLTDYLNIEKSQISIEQVLIINEMGNIKDYLQPILKSNLFIKGIFVPDFDVNEIAAYLEKEISRKIHLIGYDCINENNYFLEQGVIDFLISQKTTYQGFVAMQNLFRQFVLKKGDRQNVLMPLDIVTKQNYKFYEAI